MATQKPPKKVPAPGYETDKPLFPAISKLNEELGLQDSAIQLSEVAIQVLVEQAESSGKPVREYLGDQFSARNIPRGTHDFAHLKSFSHGTFIVQTYGLIESVLKRLGREYRQHKWLDDKWTSKDDEGATLSPLAALIANLPAKDARLVKDKPEVDLFEYYRALRVSVVHPSPDTTAKANTAFASLSKHIDEKDYFRKTYLRNAPNPPGLVNFEDFRLFTRSFKYLANVLNQACNLSPNEIADYLRCRDEDALKVPTARIAKRVPALQSYAAAVYGPRAKGLAEIDESTVQFLKLRRKVAAAVQKKNADDDKKVWRVSSQRNDQFFLTVSPRTKKKDGDEIEKFPDLSFDDVMKRLAPAKRHSRS